MTDDVLVAATALGPRMRAAREEGETTRWVPPALATAGLFQLYLPRALGGRRTAAADGVPGHRRGVEGRRVGGVVYNECHGLLGLCGLAPRGGWLHPLWGAPRPARGGLPPPPGAGVAGRGRP